MEGHPECKGKEVGVYEFGSERKGTESLRAFVELCLRNIVA